MPHKTARRLSEGRQLAAVLLLTAREALDVGPGEMATAAGCAPELVRRIEAGALDPTMDTVERILNGSGLELRAGPGTPGDLYTGSRPHAAEAARVRSSLAAARAFRAELGAPAPGPPPRALPEWDGEDPAPGRPFGAAEGRTDGGGWAVEQQQFQLGYASEDVDLTPARDHENLQRLSGALEDFGAQVRVGDESFPFTHDAESLARAAILGPFAYSWD